jgi:hypothetical protein
MTSGKYYGSSHDPRFRNCYRPQEAWAVAAQLGLEPQHVPILVAVRLLKTLGNPPHNAPKYFARDYILTLAADEKWPSRASDTRVKHWANRNARK